MKLPKNAQVCEFNGVLVVKFLKEYTLTIKIPLPPRPTGPSAMIAIFAFQKEWKKHSKKVRSVYALFTSTE